MKYYARQSISEEDISAVVDVLRSEFLTQGPLTTTFEDDLCFFTTARHTLAVSSATAALMIAYQAVLETRKEKSAPPHERPYIWVPANTFVATANAARLIGSDLSFLDIDTATGNLDLNLLEARLSSEERRPDMVVPVHYAGDCVDMATLHDLSQRFDFAIVEDASHALGGETPWGPACNPFYSDATVTSFHAVKCIATGEGGAIFTNRTEIADKCTLLRSHGITRDTNLFERVAAEPWYYEQKCLGYNYRMSDIQAALGRSQLSRLVEMRRYKDALAQAYREKLSHRAFTWVGGDRAGSAYHLMPVLLPDNTHRTDKLDLYARLRAAGYQVNVHYFPVCEQPAYKSFHGTCPKALSFYHRQFSLPLHLGITNDDIEIIVEVLMSWAKENVA